MDLNRISGYLGGKLVQFLMQVGSDVMQHTQTRMVRQPACLHACLRVVSVCAVSEARVAGVHKPGAGWCISIGEDCSGGRCQGL